MVRAGNDKLVARNIKSDSVGSFPMNNDRRIMLGERWKSAKKKFSMRKGENKVIWSHEKLIKNFAEIFMWATSEWSEGNDLMNKLCKLIMDFLFRAYTALQTRLFINWKFPFALFETWKWAADGARLLWWIELPVNKRIFYGLAWFTEAVNNHDVNWEGIERYN